MRAVVMTQAIHTLKSDFEVYRQEPTRSHRSLILNDVAKVYSQNHGFVKEIPIKSDDYLQRAYEIIGNKIFGNFPEAFLRLLPLAQTFVSNWEELQSSLSKENSLDFLDEKVELLVKSYGIFGLQLREECKPIYRGDPYGAKLNFPATINLFQRAIRETLNLDQIQKHKAAFQEKLSSRDPEIFFQIPHIALLYLFSANEQTLPEFFKGNCDEIAKQREIYETFPECDRMLLLERCFDEKVIVTDEMGRVFKETREIVITAQRGPQSLDYPSILQVVMTNL